MADDLQGFNLSSGADAQSGEDEKRLAVAGASAGEQLLSNAVDSSAASNAAEADQENGSALNVAQAPNDVATLSSDSKGLSETDAVLSTGGALLLSDLDTTDATVVAQLGTPGTYGKFSIDAAGAWSYATNDAVNQLDAGQVVTETFSVATTDGGRASVTVTLTGTNDVATLSSATEALTESDAVLTTGGTLTLADLDATDATVVAQADTAGTYGKFSIDAAGAWSYATNDAVNQLDAGQVVTETFSVATTDGGRASVTVTLTGTNDVATLSSATEALTESDAVLTTGGTLTLADLDATDATVVAQADTAGTYGKFSIDAAGAWSYATNDAVNQLDAGQVVTETFSVATTDGGRASVTVTLTGTNDVATLSSATEALTESDAVLTTGGTLTLADLDATDATVVAQADTAGTYGKFSIDAAGAWSYATNDAVNQLDAGQVVTETFSVATTDGGRASVTVTLTGTNDVATLSSATEALTESDAVLTTGGTLTLADLDATDATVVAQADTAGTYGKFSIDAAGAWSYATNDAVNQLDAGQVVTETFSVATTDGGRASVTVTLTGTNDVATLSSATEALTESDAVLTTGGTLTLADLDATDATVVAQADTAGTYGKFSIDAAGAWSYATNDAVNQLDAGQVVTETFSVATTDGGRASVTVTLTGTNDVATLSSATEALTESDAVLTTGGTLTLADLDATDATVVAQADTAGTYGKFSIDAAGAWSYATNDAVNQLDAGQVVTETFSVATTDGGRASVTVTLTGTEDNQSGTVIDGYLSNAIVFADIDNDGVRDWTDADGDALFDNSEGEAWTTTDLSGKYNFDFGSLTAPLVTIGGEDSTTGLIFTGTLRALAGSSVITPLTTLVAALVEQSTGIVETPTAEQIAAAQTTLLVGLGLPADIDINSYDPFAVLVDSSATQASKDAALAIQKASAQVANLIAVGVALGVDQEDLVGKLASKITSAASEDTPVNLGEVTTIETLLTVDGALTINQEVLDGLAAANTAVGDASNIDDVVTAQKDAQGDLVTSITNNDPVIAGTSAGSVTEDTTLSATGTLTSSDIDNGANATWTIAGSSTGTYGALALAGNSGTWTYTLANGTDGTSSVVQNLAAGESFTDTFTVRVTDDKGGFDEQLVTVTINGTNDLPVISVAAGTSAGSVTEDTTLSATGTLTSSDIDNGANATWTIAGSSTGTYGALALAGNSGTWTYTLANGTDGTSSVVQNLAAGESFTDTFTVRVTDDKGGFDEQLVTVTINGTNDLPVISVAAGTSAGSVTEDTTLSATGTLTSSDIDNGANATWTIAGSSTGTYGALALAGNSGTWTYTLANGTDGTSSVVQNLAAGESFTDTFTVRVTDDKGGFDEQLVTVTINGTNDLPVISVAAGTSAGSVTEDTTLSATGTLTSSDIDNGANATWTIAGSSTGTYGALALAGNSGTWTYTLANGTDGTSSVVQNLAAGESFTDTFTVRVTDDKGGFDEQLVTVTINGTNDLPVISVAAGTSAGSVTEDTTLSATGTLTSSDIDNGANATWTIAGSSTGTYGALALAGNSGTWTYTLANGTDGTSSVVQNLAAGESFTDTFTVRVTDDKGGFDEQLVTVTINGTNDLPVISVAAGTSAGSVTEDTTLSATGTLTSSDIDNGANATWTIAGSSTGTYGALALAGNSGTWTYTLANGTDGTSSVVQNLAAGESFTDTFTVRVTDDKGGFDEQLVTVTINGTNDLPVISVAAGTSAGSVTEDTTLSATGTLTSSDIDNGANATWTIAGSSTGTYGALALAGNSGTWTYTLANGTDGTSSVVQNLAAGESFTDTFTVRVTDDKGGFDEQLVTVTINGTNDLPVISVAAGTSAGSVTEDTTLSATGTLTSSDIDNGANATWTIAGSSTGTYGALALAGNSGTWTYTLANGTDGTSSVVQNLAAGESFTDTFTVRVTDDKGGFDEQLVTVTINGTNDLPVISVAAGTSAGSVTEDTTLSATGTLTSSDIDNGANATWTIAGSSTGTYGALALAGNSGTWTYTLANGTDGTSSVVQNLAAGESFTDTFTVRVTDDKGGFDEQLVTVTINGTNDLPVISVAAGTSAGSVTEDTTLSATGTLTSSDIDNGANATWTIAGSSTGTYGALALAGNSGTWTYTLANGTDGTSSVVQNLAAGESFTDTFTVRVTDDKGGFDEQLVTVTINGTNDLPVISVAAGTSAGSVTEDTTLSATGTLTSSDIDNGANATWTIAGSSTGTYGALALAGNSGTWTYTLANGTDGTSSVVQNLAAGESFTDTFTVRVTDDKGGFDEQLVTVTINGTNDLPVISVAAGTSAGSVTEDTTLSATGTLTSSDIDNGANATWTIAGSSTGTYGALALAGNSGTWTYTLANGTDGTSSVVQNLAAGESFTDTFTVRVTDDKGGFDEQLVTVTINGTNDLPVISVAAGTSAGSVTEDTTLSATGTLTSSDIDNGANATWTIAGSSTGTYGALALAGNSGTWTYTLANGTDGTSSVVQNLAAGESFTDTFTVRVTDDKGGFDEQLVTVTINGTNDLPVISVAAGTSAGSVTEDTTLSATGTLTSSDIDNGANATWTIAGSSTGTYGALALAGNSGTWTYTLANGTDGTSSVVQNLAAGESFTDTFTVRVTDDKGGFDEQLVTVTINGTNDLPVISVAAGTSAGSVTEDTTLSATGTLTSSDIDNGANATWTIAGSSTGTYGALALAGNSGTWTYTLANGTDGTSSVVQNLAAGESFTDTFTVRVTDDKGGFDEQLVTVTINGTNDLPVISVAAGTSAGSVTEDTTLSATGTLTSSDIDNGANATWTIAGSSTGTYGALALAGNSGTWTYTLANGTDGTSSVVQNLAAGESFTDTFTVRVTDDKGGFDEQLVTVTINGTNDLPVISVAAGTSAGSVTEDTTLSATGTLTSSDIDNGANATWTIAGSSTGTYGALALAGNSGTWTYTLANGTDGTSSVVQNLAAGESFTDTFTVRVTDDKGGFDEQLVTVTINGTNDLPVISVAAGTSAGSVTEDTTLSATGTLTSSDIDNGANATWTIAGSSTGTYGALALAGNSGTWTYTLANGTDGTSSVVQNLAAGESFTDTFTVRVTDDKGGFDEQLVTVTINGTNDLPVISVAAGTSAGSVTEDTTLSATGTLTSSDIDNGANATWTIAGSSTGTYGALALAGNSGTWTYTLANGTDGTSSVVQNLAAGESFTDTFTVRVTDDKGGFDEQLVTVTINGTNDLPVISVAAGTSAGSVTEDTTLSATGTLTSSDIDNGANATWTIAGSSTGTYGALALAGNSGTWTYTLANGTDGTSSVVQNLAAGESFTDTFTVRVTDDKGGFDEQLVTVTINGTNDLPVISVAAGTSAGSVTEDTTLSATGTLTSSDIDNGANATWTIAGSSTGTYGALALAGNSGTWTYTLANGTDGTSSVVQNLAAGESFTDTFTVRVTDDKGGFDEQLVTVTINGTNDLPVISVAAGTSAGSVTEDTTLSATGTLTSSDIDNGANATWTIAGSSTGTYGALALAGNSGTWTYTLANGTDGTSSVVQNLAAGESFTDTFTVRVTDDKGGFDEQLVTVTINGTNDLPVISVAAGTSAGSVTEDTTLSATGTLTSSDIDNGANATWTIAGSSTGTYGALALAGNSGTWTYTLANGTDGTSSVVQNLAAGESFTDTFTVRVTDDKGGFDEQLVTVTINGTNDLPVISVAAGTSAGSVTEDTTLSATGTLTSSDIDNGANATWTIAGSSTGTYGALALAGNSGTWTYTLANGTDGTSSVVQNLAAGESFTDTFTVRVTDDKGGFDEQLVTVTINGTNDLPVISFASGNAAGSVTEDTTLSATGTLTSSDIDNGANATWTIAGSSTGTYGALALDGNSGTWTYTLDNGTNGTSSVVQNLAAGESFTDTFTVRVTDDKGGFDEQLVTVTINGTNDLPVISFASGNAAGSVTEDTTLSATGTLTSSDIDNGANATWTIAGSSTGTYGALALDGNSGTWTYTLDNGTNGTSSVVQNLAAGESFTDTFTVRVTDDKGGFDEQLVTVTINGTNDLPVISFASGNAAGSVTEDTTLSATGTLTSSDIDNGANATWTIAGSSTGTYGALALDGNSGTWTYTLDNGTNGTSSVVQNLAAGESFTDTFTVRVTDDKGGFDEQLVTVTINGTNDLPVISFASGNAAGSVTEDTTLSATGTLTSSDIDNGANATWTIAGSSTGTYGALALDGNSGTWTYTLDNGTNGTSSVVQNLAAGESFTDTFTVRVTDDKGGFDEQLVTVTINGTNDLPVISFASGNAAGSVTEDTTLSATGTLTSSDIDNGANATWTIAGSSTGTYGALALDGNSGTWTYTLDNGTNGTSSVVQNLAAGESFTDTFTVRVTDDKGGFDEQLVTVTINGTNDLPVISFASGNAAGSVTEDTTLSATGTLTSSDIDNGANATWTIAGSSTGTYGALALDGNSGTWTYTLDNGTNGTSSVVQNLAAGESFTDTFTVRVTDDKGGFDEQLVTVTINGTNDLPVISFASGNAAGSVTEDTTLSATGTLTSSDIDNGANATWTIAGSSTGTYGALALDGNSGTWTYTLDNGTNGTSSVVQNLAAGESFTDTFTVRVTDDKGGFDEQLVTVTINGTNDLPVISFASGNAAGSVTEDTTLSATGTLTSSDIDNGANATWTIAGSSTGTYGALALDGNSGTWTYTLDNGTNGTSSVVQNLAAGESFTDTFTVRVTDDKGGFDEQLVTVTINGTNDLPVISFASGNAAGSVTEDTTLSATGTLTSSDIDNGANATWTIAGSSTGTYGALALDGNSGTWTYTLDNGTNGTSSVVQNLAAGESFTDTFTVRVTDDKGGFDEQLVTVTINGANDAAVITGTSTGSVTEAGGLSNATAGTPTATGNLNSTDVDNTADAWTAVTSASTSTGGYGTYTVTSAGVWTYTLNNSNAAVQALNSGGTLTDTFSVSTVDGTSQTVTVTINGANDAAVITGTSTGSVTEAGGLSNATAGTPTATGNLNSTDVDNTADAWTAVTSASTSTGGYGTYTVTSAGVWTYTLNNSNAAVQALNSGGTLTDTFSVSTVDGTSQTVTVTINGANDAAVITGTSTGSVTEAGGVANATAGTPTASGNLNSTDVDNTADAWTAVTSASTSTGGYGTYTVTSAGVWTYTLNNSNAAVQALNSGGTLTDTFSVSTVDGTSQTVTVTINGANDAAVITGTSTGSVTEAGGVANATAGTPTATGNLNSTDVDNTADAWTAVTSASTSTGGYGTYTVTSAGVWTYTLNNSNAAVQALNSGGTLTDTFSVSTVDGTSQIVTVTINGTNDAAVITGTSTGSVTEAGGVANATAGTPTASGNLNSTDVDNNADSWTAVTSASTSTGGYGTYTVTSAGVWTYTLNNSNAAVQALNSGGTLTDTFSVSTVDGTSQIVTVTINGTNDGPVAVNDTGSATEAGGSQAGSNATGNVLTNDADPDSSETVTAVRLGGTESSGTAGTVGNSLAGTYGSLTLNANGSYTYVVNNSDSAVQALNTGDTLTESFNYTVSDGTLTDAAVLTITITGTDEVITGTTAGETLSGTAWNDQITGGTGSDILTGGTGSDRFIFRKGEGSPTEIDTITDFLKNTDTIVISGSAISGVTVSAGTKSGNTTTYTITVDYTNAASDTFRVALEKSTLNDADKTGQNGVVISSGSATIDGTIVGATLYLDINHNSQEDAGERLGVSDAQGHVEWVVDLAMLDINGDGQYTIGEARAVQTGGYDIDTKLTYEINLYGQVGGSIISPLSSLLQALLESGISLDEANTTLAERLGLPLDVDFSSFNPLEGGQHALGMNAAVMTTAIYFAELAAAHYSTDEASVSFTAFKAISVALDKLPEGDAANFGDPALYQSIARELGLLDLLTDDIVQLMVASQDALNYSIENLQPGEDALASISAVQHLTQGSYAGVLESVILGDLSATAIQALTLTLTTYSNGEITIDQLADFDQALTNAYLDEQITELEFTQALADLPISLEQTAGQESHALPEYTDLSISELIENYLDNSATSSEAPASTLTSDTAGTLSAPDYSTPLDQLISDYIDSHVAAAEYEAAVNDEDFNVLINSLMDTSTVDHADNSGLLSDINTEEPSPEDMLTDAFPELSPHSEDAYEPQHPINDSHNIYDSHT